MVDSCGFESFHIGDHPDPRAQFVAQEHGIDISHHVSRLFSMEDFNNFDRIYVMDSSHFYRLNRLARNEDERKKINYILNVVYPGKDLPVPDPWYDDLNAFEKVYNLLKPACEIIADNITQMTKK